MSHYRLSLSVLIGIVLSLSGCNAPSVEREYDTSLNNSCALDGNAYSGKLCLPVNPRRAARQMIVRTPQNAVEVTHAQFLQKRAHHRHSSKYFEGVKNPTASGGALTATPV